MAICLDAKQKRSTEGCSKFKMFVNKKQMHHLVEDISYFCAN